LQDFPHDRGKFIHWRNGIHPTSLALGILRQGFFFGLVSPLLALLHWPDFGGTTADSSDFDTSGEISPKKKSKLASFLHYPQ